LNVYVYPTDRDWFDFLRTRPELDEVNFWRPGGEQAFRQLNTGDLLLFRLKSPIDKIAGGGVYVHFSIYPVGLAWEAFGVKNGAADERAFDERIARYKGLAGADALTQDARIGCIILQAPFFLPEQLWTDVPPDYPRNSTQGMRFDSATGSGKELFTAVTRAVQLLPPTRRVAEPAPIEMFGDPVLVKRRLGQGAFRVLVTDNFERRCAVTGEKTLPVLQAAHILPVKKGGQHRPDNGLLLRSDLHTLFDLGYVTVTPDYKLAVSPALRHEWSNGRVYYDMQDRTIRLPTLSSDHPSREFLEWHRETVFRS
jgi:putative restriction endonuclease